MKTTPQATPVAITTTEEDAEAVMEDASSVDLEPVTAFESVTPDGKKIHMSV